jgi:hypothetical protein
MSWPQFEPNTSYCRYPYPFNNNIIEWLMRVRNLINCFQIPAVLTYVIYLRDTKEGSVFLHCYSIYVVTTASYLTSKTETNTSKRIHSSTQVCCFLYFFLYFLEIKHVWAYIIAAVLCLISSIDTVWHLSLFDSLFRKTTKVFEWCTKQEQHLSCSNESFVKERVVGMLTDKGQ